MDGSRERSVTPDCYYYLCGNCTLMRLRPLGREPDLARLIWDDSKDPDKVPGTNPLVSESLRPLRWVCGGSNYSEVYRGIYQQANCRDYRRPSPKPETNLP